MKMRNYYLLIVLFTLGVNSICAQEAKPLRFGVELDGRMKKTDPNTGYDLLTGAAYIGAFAEYHVSNHFSGKLRAGLNNTYYHYDLKQSGIVTLPELSVVKPTFAVSLEPRYYLFSTERTQGVNWYAALPVTFETAPSWTNGYFVRAELMIIPTIGFRYDFNSHWGIEASAGLGWGKYIKGKGLHFANGEQMHPSEVDGSLSAGLRYTF